jgi:hypothetical protein
MQIEAIAAVNEYGDSRFLSPILGVTSQQVVTEWTPMRVRHCPSIYDVVNFYWILDRPELTEKMLKILMYIKCTGDFKTILFQAENLQTDSLMGLCKLKYFNPRFYFNFCKPKIHSVFKT